MDDALQPETARLSKAELLVLVEASRAVNAEQRLDQVMEQLAAGAARVVNARGASVLLLEADGDELIFHTAVGPGADKLLGKRFDSQEGIAGQVVQTRRAVRIDDVAQNRRFLAGFDALSGQVTSSMIAAPMILGDEVIGVVEVINPGSGQHFTDHDLSLLQVFANLVASATRSAQTIDRLSRQNLGHRVAAPGANIVGRTPAIRRVLELCRKVAPAATSVLITGETGTGKEMAARAVHTYSKRSENPFIAVNCAALTETLLESELFGHEKGAFTGATEQRAGRFELADGGTLFLDEVGEMSLSCQAKLLRVLQERELTRVGGTRSIRCDVRIVAATNRDLKDEVGLGRFREDLYYRLNVFPIALPPLRDRLDDLPELAQNLLERAARRIGIDPPSTDPAAMAALKRYAWPGNIRELQNVLERASLLCDGRITPDDLPLEIADPRRVPAPRVVIAPGIAGVAGEVAAARGSGGAAAGAGASTLAAHEKALVTEALEASGWNQSAAARGLGISRDLLRYRVKKHGIRRETGAASDPATRPGAGTRRPGAPTP